MRNVLIPILTLCLSFWFTTVATAKPKLELSDEGLALQESRPLDRRVYVLTLDGKWNAPAAPAVYYINVLFPDGGSYAHKVLDPDLFPKGEVRCVIQGYQLARHGISGGGKFSIVVSEGKPVTSANAPEVISEEKEFSWPMQRRISKYRPHTRHQPPEPVDAFPIPGEEDAKPKAKPKPAPAPNPDKGTKSAA
jgi:hypothetical protein